MYPPSQSNRFQYSELSRSQLRTSDRSGLRRRLVPAIIGEIAGRVVREARVGDLVLGVDGQAQRGRGTLRRAYTEQVRIAVVAKTLSPAIAPRGSK